MTPFVAVVSGLVAGLASAPHCAAMCGPVAGLACSGRAKPIRAALHYQVGRTLIYSTLGAVAGALGARASHSLSSPWVARSVSLAFALALAWVAVRLWRRARRLSVPALVSLGRGPSSDTAANANGSRSSLRVGPFELGALAIGLGSGFLPCGALGLALLAAAGTGASATGAAFGFGFATATATGLLASGTAFRLLSQLRRPFALYVLAAAFAAGAVFLGLRPFTANDGAPCPLHRHLSSQGREHGSATGALHADAARAARPPPSQGLMSEAD